MNSQQFQTNESQWATSFEVVLVLTMLLANVVFSTILSLLPFGDIVYDRTAKTNPLA